MTPRPTVICLCGSTRFWRDYLEWNDIETRGGKIVLSVGCFVHQNAVPLTPAIGIYREVSADQKKKLDELHLRKIDMADEVLFLNRNGYMGESTRNELAYARAQHKRIRFLEPIKAKDREPGK